MAAAMPSGTANRVVKKVRYTVPRIAGRMPPERMPSLGNWNKNSSDRAGRPFQKMKTTMNKMGRIVRKASSASTAKPSCWMVLRREELAAGRWWWSGGCHEVFNELPSGQDALGALARPEDHAGGGDVDRQRDQEQHNANEKQHMVVGAVGCHFAHLGGDRGGHGANR